MNESTALPVAANLAVVRGGVVSAPNVRDLPSGSVVAQFDVVTMVAAGDRCVPTSVPVAWIDPRATDLAAIGAGTEVLVVGTVRRRFFRVGGATQTRTEVVADIVIPTRRHKQVAAALRSVADALTAS